MADKSDHLTVGDAMALLFCLLLGTPGGWLICFIIALALTS